MVQVTVTCFDAIVVGAGPVGMLAALLLAQKGGAILLLEQAVVRQRQSRAIGITPPSLEILSCLGLDEVLVHQGVPVRVAEVYGHKKYLGRVNFSEIMDDYPFVLSIPQDRTEALLEEMVITQPAIRYLRGYHVTHCSEQEDCVTVCGTGADTRRFDYSGRYVLACDGGKSAVRESLKIPFEGAPDRYTYLMGDFRDITGWGNKACFFLTARGSVESFPLSGGNRRFVVRTSAFIQEYATGYLATEPLSRCGINVSGVSQLWESGFGVQHYMARRFCTGRIFLCGDAAHLMSPIGGQNMNTGFADAELAAWLTGKLLNNRAPHHLVSRLYNRVRREAALSALRRARWMMLIGTSGGSLWSAVRNLAATCLLHTPLRRYMTLLFSMQSIPYRNLKLCQKEYEKELKL